MGVDRTGLTARPPMSANLCRSGSSDTFKTRQEFRKNLLMPQPASITAWITQLKSGDVSAAQKLWEAYFHRMVNLARQRLEGVPRAAADEEDVALSAFRSFCLGAREGRFSQLVDSDNLWPLLMAITSNKSVDLIRAQNRRKRGGTGRPTDSDGAEPDQSANHRETPARRSVSDPVPLSDLISREPTPEFAAELSDNLQRLLQLLDETGDLDLRQIALLKMEGHSSAEIAQQLACATRSVERKMHVITRLWSREVDGTG
jgi:DNA-directed RNA polymerase specialized sigma24 family protein